MHVPALQRSLPDVVAEYDRKLAAIPEAVKAFERAGTDLKMAACVAGTYGDVTIDTGRIYESSLRTNLLKSAWKHVFSGLNLDLIATAKDKQRWKIEMENPPAFTIDNIRGTFGDYVKNPRASILRGLAEVFSDLDQAYKSHERMKIGVAGLPKRIVLRSVGYSDSYGRQKLRDILNALAAYRGEPLTEYKDFNELDALHSSFKPRTGTVVIRGAKKIGDKEIAFDRGVTVKKYLNNNAHVMFDKASLRDINKALAEFYGNVLPDCAEAKPANKKPGTAVSKDLQYYPTPEKVVDHVLEHHVGDVVGVEVLEPSCGDGRFLDGLRKRKAKAYGIEVDALRAAAARSKGHTVLTANFLATPAVKKFKVVVMNPPFYGTHYAEHVLHAMDFIEPGGRLIAILPVTAREHGLLDHLLPKKGWSTPWHDLPVGSFSDSGTNINTVVLTLTKARADG
jgi:hypothetical protein